jgi:hypothetical protein
MIAGEPEKNIWKAEYLDNESRWSVAVSSTLLYIQSSDKTNQLSKNSRLSFLKHKRLHSIKRATNVLFNINYWYCLRRRFEINKDNYLCFLSAAFSFTSLSARKCFKVKNRKYLKLKLTMNTNICNTIMY